MRTKTPRAIIFLLCAVLISNTAHAWTVYPVFNSARYNSILVQIEKMREQIKEWSEIVGIVKEQIRTLSEVSNAITDLKEVAGGGIQGIIGDFAAQLGLDAIFTVGKESQKLFTDTQNLIRDAQELPEEAKKQIRDLGYSIDDIKDFIRNGLVYDTLTKLGAEEWSMVAKDPINALKNGSLGMAIARSEGYLSEENRSSAWRNFIGGLSEEEKKNLGPLLGGAFATNLAAEWYGKMESRVKKVADLREVGNKLSKIIEPKKKKKKKGDKDKGDDDEEDEEEDEEEDDEEDDEGDGDDAEESPSKNGDEPSSSGDKDQSSKRSENLLNSMGTLNQTKNWRDRINMNANLQKGEIQHIMMGNEARRTELEAKHYQQDRVTDDASLINVNP